MRRQIQITLSEETIQLLEQSIGVGGLSVEERDRLIDEAIHFYFLQKQREKIAERLQEGAIRRSERDLNLARDWFSLEEELWKKK